MPGPGQYNTEVNNTIVNNNNQSGTKIAMTKAYRKIDIIKCKPNNLIMECRWYYE